MRSAVLWTFVDSSSVARFSSGTAFKCSLLQRIWSHLQWMVSNVLNNWVLFPAGVVLYFHTAVSIPAVGPIQRSVGRCRGKERIWLLNNAPPCFPHITQHCHHQVEIFVNWPIVASAAFGPAAEPGSHQCEEGKLQFRFSCTFLRHQTSCTYYASKCNDTTELQVSMAICRSHLWSTDTALHIYKYHTAILQINMLADLQVSTCIQRSTDPQIFCTSLWIHKHRTDYMQMKTLHLGPCKCHTASRMYPTRELRLPHYRSTERMAVIYRC